jgi:hypothetical protein
MQPSFKQPSKAAGWRPTGFWHLGHRMWDGMGVWQNSQTGATDGPAAIPITTFPKISELRECGSHNSSNSAWGRRRNGP